MSSLASMFVPSKEYTGQEFNEILGSKKLYRFTRYDEIHNDFQYNDGLNVDHLEFYPHDACKPGGLYFVDEDHIIRYLFSHLFQWIREVTIPPDARVYVEKGKYKSDKFVLGPRKRTSEYEIDKHRCLEAVKQDYRMLQFVKEQTHDICMEAVKHDSESLQYVRKQSHDICLEAVKQAGWALEYVTEQTYDICLEAVKENPLVLRFVKEQNEEICLQALTSDSYCVKFVRADLLQLPTIQAYVSPLKQLTQPTQLTQPHNNRHNQHNRHNYYNRHN